MNLQVNDYIYEAVDNLDDTSKKRWMNAEERSLIKNLEKYLADDGHGTKHGKYAELLREFDITFVNGQVNPSFTAAVSFETHMIYISTGFIMRDPAKREQMFAQLSVLIRHEMAHVMMQHQIRMIAEWNSRHGKDAQERLSCSQSLHNLNNIIEDFEISNKRYNSRDKRIVNTMTLNGEIIGGLITEEFRDAWKNYSLEEMYNALVQDIESMQKVISRAIDSNSDVNLDNMAVDDMYRMIFDSGRRSGIGSYDYIRAYNTVSGISDVDELVDMAKNNKLAQNFSLIVQNIADRFRADDCDSKFINEQIKNITKTAPTEFYELKDPTGKIITVLYTPEEKFLTIELCKSIRDDLTTYERWFAEVKEKLGNGKYTDDELQKIFDAIS